MRILHFKVRANSIDQVALDYEGGHVVCLRKGGMRVTGNVLPADTSKFHEYLDVHATGEYGFSRVGTRRYLNQDGIWMHEAMFANITSGTIERPGMLGKEPAMAMGIDMSSVNVIRSSQDGRYVAAGDGDGRVEVWNLDLAEPHRVFAAVLDGSGAVADIAFSRTNLEVTASTTCGGTFLLKPLANDWYPLHCEERQWPCYSLDCQPEGDGFVFGGEGGVLWFLNLAFSCFDKSVNPDAIPFAMGRGRTITGATYDYVVGMHRARVGCLRTGVGSYVHQVRFISDTVVAVLGPEGTEVWELGDEPVLIAHRSHDVDSRLLGFCLDGDDVRVALGLRES